MSGDFAFDKSKSDILKDIQNGVDWSPKGSIDLPAKEIVAFINNLPDFVTTSSCSGRISCFRDNNRTKGIEWLLVKHRTITLNELRDAVQDHKLAHVTSETQTTSTPLVIVKCEPFILHVQCRNISAAQQLHQLGMGCGYRESGIGLGQRKTMVAIRTTAFSMELPVSIGHKFILDDNALRIIISECNRKLLSNFARIDRLLQKLKNQYVWPAFSLGPLLPSQQGEANLLDQAFYGHSSVLVQSEKKDKTGRSAALVTVGGSGSCGRSVRPHVLSFDSTSHSVSELDSILALGTVHSTMVKCAVYVREDRHAFTLQPSGQRMGAERAASVGGLGMSRGRRCELIVICGGRKSPVRALPALFQTFLHDPNPSLQPAVPHHTSVVSVTEQGDVPAARWGHAMVVYDASRWILTGGRDEKQVFSDAFVLELEPSAVEKLGLSQETPPRVHATLRWTRLQQAALPAPLFFHAMCSVQNTCAGVVLAGGLGTTALHGDPSPSQESGVFALTLPSFASDSSCLYDEVDDVRVETSVLATKLRWHAMEVDKALGPLGVNRFGHSMTYLGANSIAVIGGNTFDPHFEVNGEVSDKVEVWDVSAVDLSASTADRSWCKYSSEEVHCTFTASLRYIGVHNRASHRSSLELGLGQTRSHHQAMFQESIHPVSKVIESRLLLTGGGLECAALFGSTFGPSLSLQVTCQSRVKERSNTATAEEHTPGDEALPLAAGTCPPQRTATACRVLLIPKNRVRGVKVYLDANKWLDRSSRISTPPAEAEGTPIAQVICSLPHNHEDVQTVEEQVILSADETAGMMAVPVTSTFFEMFTESGDTAPVLGREDFAALHALLVLPVPLTTESAAERKKMSKGKGKGAHPCMEKEQPTGADVRGNSRVVMLQFSEQDCKLNKTKIASLGAVMSSCSVDSHKPRKEEPQGSGTLKDIITCRPVTPLLRGGHTTSLARTTLIPKSRVRAVKVFLEAHLWLDKDSRISAASADFGSDGAALLVSCSLPAGGDKVGKEVVKLKDVSSVCSVLADMMAVPVTSSFFEMFTESGDNSPVLGREDFAALHALLVLPVPQTTESAAERKKRSKGKGKGGQPGPVLEGMAEESVQDRQLSMVFARQECNMSKVKVVSGHAKAVEYFRSFIPDPKDMTLLNDIPSKFEMVGDVIMIPEDCLQCPVWASITNEAFWVGLLSCFNHGKDGRLRKHKRVARKARVDPGLKRESRVRLLYPSTSTNSSAGPDGTGWTEVIENGITFGFDITKVMFCSGNVTERMRASGLTKKAGREVVVDLYAGIGYYTIPLLVHGGARCVHACEWNPNSTTALRANLIKAGVKVFDGDLSKSSSDEMPECERFCRVYEGDNAISARCGGPLQNVADRVSLGLIPSSVPGWPLGVTVMKLTGGMLHVHENVKDDEMDKWVKDTCEQFEFFFAEKQKRRQAEDEEGQSIMVVRCIHLERVKSYAPHLYHVVADLHCFLKNV